MDKVEVREESYISRLRMRFRKDTLNIDDQDNLIKYTLASPSNEYLLFLLLKVSGITSPRALTGPAPLMRLTERASEEIADVFDLLRRSLPRFFTLRLESGRNRTSNEYEKYASAFLFQLSYNLDTSFVPQRHLEELVRSGRITIIRRSNPSEIDPPRRHYIPDLIYHYQLAVASDNPFLEFISYYHIAEHFFESVFNEDLIERIRIKITQPDFSYKRQKDIGGLIKDISKSLQIRNEKVTFSESEALRLTIYKFVDLDDLRDKVNNYDNALLDYYRQTKVSFSDGDTVDLREADQQAVIKKLSARIYKTRNAVVHSKESDKVRYVPFRDDRNLVKEVPLLRFIAEQIIIGSSNVVS
jgi:hypothetical protein